MPNSNRERLKNHLFAKLISDIKKIEFRFSENSFIIMRLWINYRFIKGIPL